jgi:hypothetical protein
LLTLPAPTAGDFVKLLLLQYSATCTQVHVTIQLTQLFCQSLSESKKVVNEHECKKTDGQLLIKNSVVYVGVFILLLGAVS